MTGEQHVDEVNRAQNPAPTYDNEKNEYNDVNNILRSQSHGQSNKQFADPTNYGKEQENCFDECRLAVKPFIEFHSAVCLLIYLGSRLYDII